MKCYEIREVAKYITSVTFEEKQQEVATDTVKISKSHSFERDGRESVLREGEEGCHDYYSRYNKKANHHIGSHCGGETNVKRKLFYTGSICLISLNGSHERENGSLIMRRA